MYVCEKKIHDPVAMRLPINIVRLCLKLSLIRSEKMLIFCAHRALVRRVDGWGVFAFPWMIRGLNCIRWDGTKKKSKKVKLLCM
jgi:hypothetical protein